MSKVIFVGDFENNNYLNLVIFLKQDQYPWKSIVFCTGISEELLIKLLA